MSRHLYVMKVGVHPRGVRLQVSPQVIFYIPVSLNDLLSLSTALRTPSRSVSCTSPAVKKILPLQAVIAIVEMDDGSKETISYDFCNRGRLMDSEMR